MIMKMSFVEKWEWVSGYSRRQCRRWFFRTRAAVNKAMKSNGCKLGGDQLRFQYDPLSYALNFDDGCCHSGEDFRQSGIRNCIVGAGKSGGAGTVLILVLWVNPVAK